MRKALAPKTAQRSENAVLDQAIQQLLGAMKDAAKKKGKPLDPAQLRKEGYSERFLAMRLRRERTLPEPRVYSDEELAAMLAVDEAAGARFRQVR